MSAADAPDGIHRIKPGELDAGLRSGARITVIDVRRRERWTAEAQRIPGAIWLPLEEVPQRARDLPQDTHLVVYCS